MGNAPSVTRRMCEEQPVLGRVCSGSGSVEERRIVHRLAEMMAAHASRPRRRVFDVWTLFNYGNLFRFLARAFGTCNKAAGCVLAEGQEYRCDATSMLSSCQKAFDAADIGLVVKRPTEERSLLGGLSRAPFFMFRTTELGAGPAAPGSPPPRFRAHVSIYPVAASSPTDIVNLHFAFDHSDARRAMQQALGSEHLGGVLSLQLDPEPGDSPLSLDTDFLEALENDVLPAVLGEGTADAASARERIRSMLSAFVRVMNLAYTTLPGHRIGDISVPDVAGPLLAGIETKVAYEGREEPPVPRFSWDSERAGERAGERGGERAGERAGESVPSRPASGGAGAGSAGMAAAVAVGSPPIPGMPARPVADPRPAAGPPLGLLAAPAAPAAPAASTESDAELAARLQREERRARKELQQANEREAREREVRERLRAEREARAAAAKAAEAAEAERREREKERLRKEQEDEQARIREQAKASKKQRQREARLLKEEAERRAREAETMSQVAKLAEVGPGAQMTNPSLLNVIYGDGKMLNRMREYLPPVLPELRDEFGVDTIMRALILSLWNESSSQAMLPTQIPLPGNDRARLLQRNFAWIQRLCPAAHLDTPLMVSMSLPMENRHLGSRAAAVAWIYGENSEHAGPLEELLDRRYRPRVELQEEKLFLLASSLLLEFLSSSRDALMAYVRERAGLPEGSPVPEQLAAALRFVGVTVEVMMASVARSARLNATVDMHTLLLLDIDPFHRAILTAALASKLTAPLLAMAFTDRVGALAQTQENATALVQQIAGKLLGLVRLPDTLVATSTACRHLVRSNEYADERALTQWFEELGDEDSAANKAREQFVQAFAPSGTSTEEVVQKVRDAWNLRLGSRLPTDVAFAALDRISTVALRLMMLQELRTDLRMIVAALASAAEIAKKEAAAKMAESLIAELDAEAAGAGAGSSGGSSRKKKPKK
jgi:hypothetical protein